MMAKGGGRGLARMAGMLGAGGGMDRLKALGGGRAPVAEGGAPGLPGLGGGALPPGFNPFKKS